MKKLLIVGASVLMTSNVMAACPSVTGPDAGGVNPHLFELAEYESAKTAAWISPKTQ